MKYVLKEKEGVCGLEQCKDIIYTFFTGGSIGYLSHALHVKVSWEF